jgi:heat shock protein HslJ
VAYLLEAVGPGGTSRGQQNISVVEPATATPEPAPPPEDPVIYSFSVSPSQIPAGECVGLAWNVGGGTTYSRILRNGAVIVDDAGYTGQVMDCLDQAGSYTYQIEAQNPAGQVVQQQQPVNVVEAEPQNPLADTRWRVATFDNPAAGGVSSVLPGTTLTMAFSPDGGVNGSSGCNSYSATYLVDGSQLSITPPVGTGMMCAEPEGIMEQEAAFLAFLPTVNGFSMEGNSLYLLNGSGQAMAELTGY